MRIRKDRQIHCVAAHCIEDGGVFAYESHFYVKFRLGCADLDISYRRAGRTIPALNLKSGTMRLLNHDQLVTPMDAECHVAPESSGEC
jgi:hypothetical protein